MKRRLPLFTLLLLMVSGLVLGQTNGREVMLQGFNWESHSSTSSWYNVVNGRAADLESSQIDAVWLPPATDAASDQGYLPRELYKLDSKYGTQAELQELIGELHSRDIKVLADIVINHRVGLTGWGDFTNPTWGCWGATSDDEWESSCGNFDTGTPYEAARDIDHTNETVRQDIKDWMNWLKEDIGFDGWRYDYVHGFGAKYIEEYNNATSPYFSVGELWDGDRQRIVDWIDGTQGASTAFDFPTKFALHAAVNGDYSRLNSGGQAPGVIGWWPEKAVTFIDNHDTGSTQSYDPFPGEHVMQGYAYILTHPGTPMVFWDHFYDWGLHDEIAALINVRKANDLTNTSAVSIQRADGSVYAAIVDDKVAMKIGGGAWSPDGSGWELRTSGNNYAVWDRGTATDNANEPGEAPVVTVDPAGPFASPDAITVTITATDNSGIAPAIYYTIDGSEPSESAETANGAVTIEVREDLTLKVYAIDNEGLASQAQTHNYTINASESSFTVYYKKPSEWASSLMVHHWGAEPAGSFADSAWPGKSMKEEGDGWYSFTFNNITFTNLLFHDNAGLQTADLSRNSTGWYFNGVWYDEDPRVPAEGLTIHLKTEWATPTLYYWNVEPAGATENATWPGVAMRSEGNGWWSYTIPAADCANLIFSDNRSSQTADLYRCGEGWYMDGKWYNTDPSVAVSFNRPGNVEPYGFSRAGQLRLQANYPNPARETTKIAFYTPTNGNVLLTLLDRQGIEVAVLQNGYLKAGHHVVELDVSALNNGIYPYKLESQNGSCVKQMVVIH